MKKFTNIGVLLLVSLLAIATSLGAKEYLLQKDDTIRMTVFQEPELETTSQIGKSGYVSFQLIGNVKMVGMSLKGAEKKLKDLYEKDYLQSAQVNLSIAGYAEKWVIVGGDVASPGTIKYPEAGALDLRGAIAQAGGARETANTGHIIVRRRGGGARAYSLSSAGGLKLQHGDTITVTRNSLSRSTFTVTGLVGNPGVVEYPKAGKMDIVTAIAQAGGFSRIANKKSVLVRRGGKQYSVSLKNIERGKDKMFYMQPGDILTVKESVF